ncbi:hypothetical protein Tco_0736475 [Tanacetum coccineum]
MYIGPNEFEFWECGKLMEEFKLENHKWLTKMFDIRSTWIPAFFIDSLLCGLMRMTSRHVQERMDHKTIDTVPKLKTFLKIESHASKNKKKKKPQSKDKGNDKAIEKDHVYLFIKKDGFYKELWNVEDGSTVCSYERRLGAFVEQLKSLKKQVEADGPNPPSKNKTDNLEQLIGFPKPASVEVNNPSVGSTKGRRKLRIKGGKEKEIAKSLKGKNSCLLCGGADHNKRTCPGRFEVQVDVVQKEVC